MEKQVDISPEASVHLKFAGGKLIVEADFDVAAFAAREEGQVASPALKMVIGIVAQLIKLVP